MSAKEITCCQQRCYHREDACDERYRDCLESGNSSGCYGDIICAHQVPLWFSQAHQTRDGFHRGSGKIAANEL
jgi:hypothetical protein